MRSCDNCGHALDDQAAFCPQCGETQAAQNTASTQTAAPEKETVPAESGGETAGAAPADLPAEAPAAPETIAAPAETASAETVDWRLPPDPSADLQPSTDASESAAPAYTGMDFRNEAPEKKKNKLPLAVGVCVAAVAVIAIVVFSVLQLMKTPEQKFVAYQQKFVINNLLAPIETAAKQYNTATEFSTDLSLRAEVDGNDELQQYLEGTSIEMKLDLKKDKFLGNINLNLMGSQVLGGIFSYKEGVIGFSIPEIDEKHYTLDVDQFLEEQGISGINNLKLPEISAETLMKLGKLYNNIILGTVNSSNLKEEKNVDIFLPKMEKTVKGDLYTFTPKAEDLEKMLTALAETIQEDQELRNFIVNLVGNNEGLLGISEDTDFAAELDKMLNQAASELKESAKELAQNMENSGFRWVTGVSGKQVVYQSFDTSEDSGFVYEASGNMKKEGAVILSYQAYGTTEMLLKHNWKKDGDTVTGSCGLSTEYDGSFTVDYTQDAKKKSILEIPYGTYKFSSDDGYQTVEFQIDVSAGENGGTDHIVNIAQLDEYSDSLGEISGIKIILHTSDEKSTAVEASGEAVDLSGYSEEELEAFFRKFGEGFTKDILNKLPMGIMGY